MISFFVACLWKSVLHGTLIQTNHEILLSDVEGIWLSHRCRSIEAIFVHFHWRWKSVFSRNYGSYVICFNRSPWLMACKVLEQLRFRGLPLSPSLYEEAIAACATGDQQKEARRLLSKMLAAGYEPSKHLGQKQKVGLRYVGGWYVMMCRIKGLGPEFVLQTADRLLWVHLSRLEAPQHFLKQRNLEN